MSWYVSRVGLCVQVLALRHGVMLVGPPCCGKSSAWRTLLAALEADGTKGEAYVIDPKVGTHAAHGYRVEKAWWYPRTERHAEI